MNGMILYPTDDDIWSLNVALVRAEMAQYPMFVVNSDNRIFLMALLKYCKLPKPLKINETVLG